MFGRVVLIRPRNVNCVVVDIPLFTFPRSKILWMGLGRKPNKEWHFLYFQKTTVPDRTFYNFSSSKSVHDFDPLQTQRLWAKIKWTYIFSRSSSSAFSGCPQASTPGLYVAKEPCVAVTHFKKGNLLEMCWPDLSLEISPGSTQAHACSQLKWEDLRISTRRSRKPFHNL